MGSRISRGGRFTPVSKRHEERHVESSSENHLSDVNAKKAFCGELARQGYQDARIIGSPADIKAFKDGHTWYFEVKYTAKQDVYFGAATLTEWMAAVANPTHFRFIVAYRTKGEWLFDEYTPDEFMAYSSIPPFKVYFSVPIGKPLQIPLSRTESRRIRLTEARLRIMGETYEALRGSR
jgi:Domain of unknown function (DUF3883)